MYKGTESGTVALGLDDEELRCAARLVSGAMGDFCPAPEDEDYEFSPGFHAKMAALIKKQRIRESAASALKGVASTAAVLVLCVSLWLGTDVEARADFKQWILTQYENSSLYQFLFEDTDKKELPMVRVGWMPEGYVQAEVFESENEIDYIYTNGEEDSIILSCIIMSSDSQVDIFDCEADYEKMEINGMSADFYLSQNQEDTNTLVWIDENAQVMYLLDANLEKAEMIKIAENVASDFD